MSTKKGKETEVTALGHHDVPVVHQKLINWKPERAKRRLGDFDREAHFARPKTNVKTERMRCCLNGSETASWPRPWPFLIGILLLFSKFSNHKIYLWHRGFVLYSQAKLKDREYRCRV